MKLKFPGMPEIIGHAGVNGSFAYYVRSKDVYLAGKINQIDKPQVVYKMIARVLSKVK